MDEQSRSVVMALILEVQQRLDEGWTLERMAHRAGYDAYHFSRIFLFFVGYSPVRYVRLLRLERACEELCYAPELSILDIGLRAGYSSSESFSRAFRRALGCSPSIYRTSSSVHSQSAPPTRALSMREAPAALQGAPPVLGVLGPLYGVAAPLEEGRADALRAAYELLAASHPVEGPWQIGGLAQPWGWVGGPFASSERWLVRYTEEAAGPCAAPLRSWRLLPSTYATFQYRGSLDLMAHAFAWIFESWLPSSRLRAGFLPTLSRLEWLEEAEVRAQLNVPVREVGAEQASL